MHEKVSFLCTVRVCPRSLAGGEEGTEGDLFEKRWDFRGRGSGDLHQKKKA